MAANCLASRSSCRPFASIIASTWMQARGPLEEERLISLKEAAARSGLSTGFLRRLCRTGRIDAVKVGRDWVTTWRAVAQYLEDEEKRSKNPFKYKKP